jgi:hypothetical protein
LAKLIRQFIKITQGAAAFCQLGGIADRSDSNPIALCQQLSIKRDRQINLNNNPLSNLSVSGRIGLIQK